jgi:hypothetical protein
MKLDDWELRERVGAKVTPGQVAINCIYVDHASDDLIVIEIDCKSKYPELGPQSSSLIYLCASEDTLFTEQSDQTTMVELLLPDGFEIGATQAGRYTVTVFCHKLSPRGVIIWQSK